MLRDRIFEFEIRSYLAFVIWRVRFFVECEYVCGSKCLGWMFEEY